MNNEEEEEYILDIKELIAYRTLEGQDFDFGNGLIKNDLTFGTEEAYWQMEQQDLESIICDDDGDKDGYVSKFDWLRKPKLKIPKLYPYYRKKITRHKLIKLKDIARWIYVSYDEYKKYYSRRHGGQKVKRDLKQISRRKVRNRKDFLLRGNGYKRVYDYWWELW